MENVSQVYVSAHWDWSSTSVWSGEGWQIGMRLACVPKIGAPQMGDSFELAASATAEGKSVTGSYTAATPSIGIIDFQQTWGATWAYAPQSFTVGLSELKAIVEAYLVYEEAMRSKISSSSRLVSVKVAPITPSGHYAAGAAEFRLRTPRSGGGGPTTLPPELAVCQSIGADVLGRRGRGRWFLGAVDMSSALASNGTINQTFREQVNTAAKALVDSLQAIDNTIPSSGQLLATVTSAGSVLGVRPSYVRVGNHFDAQRRRQHQAPESYSVTAL